MLIPKDELLLTGEWTKKHENTTTCLEVIVLPEHEAREASEASEAWTSSLFGGHLFPVTEMTRARTPGQLHKLVLPYHELCWGKTWAKREHIPCLLVFPMPEASTWLSRISLIGPFSA